MNKLSHIDSSGNPTMVDVGQKANTSRRAIAQSIVQVTSEIFQLISADELHTKKGPVFNTAIIAGIQASKRTSDLIPLCHPLSLNKVSIDITPGLDQQIIVKCMAAVDGKTGVEMEALMGASVAALTIYDMCKALSHDIRILETRLISKSGGKSEYQYDKSN